MAVVKIELNAQGQRIFDALEAFCAEKKIQAPTSTVNFDSVSLIEEIGKIKVLLSAIAQDKNVSKADQRVLTELLANWSRTLKVMLRNLGSTTALTASVLKGKTVGKLQGIRIKG